MRKVKKCLTWYFLFTKRLLFKPSFLILLCIIPLVTPVLKNAMAGESGVLRIVLCNEGRNEMAEGVIDSLMKKESIILFSDCETEKDAVEKVENHKADAAWIFDKKFDEKLDGFTGFKTTKPAVRIVERESTVSLRLSREVLFGTMYGDISRLTYKNFVYDNMLSPTEVGEKTVNSYYTSLERENNIINIQTLDEKPVENENNYLTAPLRGILSLLVLLCGLTAVMYFLKDNEDGKFDKMPSLKRILPGFASCLSAVILASVAVFLSLAFSDIWTGFLNETVSMLLYILSVTAFCMVICSVFKSYGKLGAVIPGIMIVSLVLSPIFFSLKILKPLRLLIPSHYYLYSVYNSKYYLYTVIYIIIMTVAGVILNSIIKREP